METILDFVAQKDGIFIGYYDASFPVYVVHVEYDSVDTDPFYPLDKAILRYTHKDPKHENLSYFASLIGFDRSLLTTRIRHLKEEGMIRWQKDRLIVTSDAEKKYLTANSRPTVRVSGSFLVDGKDLSFLPAFVYSSKRELMRFCKDVSPHLPVDISLKTAQSEKLIRNLEKGAVKEMLHLESSGTNFEILRYEKRFLRGAYVVFYYDAENSLHKDLVFEKSPIHCAALESPAAYSIILRTDDNDSSFIANKGYNVVSGKDIKTIALIAPTDGLCDIIQKRYKLPMNFVIKLTAQEKTELPVITIDEKILLDSPNPEIVINDAKHGFIDFSIRPSGKVRIFLSHSIERYIDFVNDISKWDLSGRKNGKLFRFELENSYPEWRKWMVLLKKYDLLEAIDRACFILNRKEV